MNLIRGQTETKYVLSAYGTSRREVSERLFAEWKRMITDTGAGHPDWPTSAEQFVEDGWVRFEPVTTDVVLVDGDHPSIPDLPE